MSRRILVDAVHPEETRVVITDEKSSILEFDFATAAKPQIKGNVYLAKVTRVEPSLQAAFVEYGGGKQGFLPFSEIHPNYYQIPVEDRQRLIEEEEAEAAQDIAEEEAEEAEETDQVTQILAAHAAGEESIASEEIDADDSDEEEEEKPKRRRGRKPKKAESEEEDKAQEDSEEASDSDDEEESDDSDESDESDDEDENEGKSRGRRRRGGRYRGRGGRGRRRGGRDRNRSSESEESGDVETISGEDEIERPRRKRDYLRRYKIQEVIKRNQVLLVQVIKEERGNKGVSLTSFLSLAGRYCVLMPNSPRGGGVSRKIGSGDDRKRLKKILSDMALPQGMSVIIRTAGAGRTRAEVKRDFDYLVKLWNQIREDTLTSSAPALVYEESNIVQRTIRDSYNTDVDEILVDGEATFKDTKAFMRKLIPSHAPKVKQYKGDTPLFHDEGVDNQLMSMMEPEVRLRSGGSIVMIPTEALISIDVNSGRSTRERNVEETALKTNLEAAREVAKQLRLRDLAGLIVIDFIDMMDGKNRRAVERVMKEALRHDRAKIQVGRISSFGLMEMSRQRLRSSIAESVSRTCPHCKGIGSILSESAEAMQIIRAIEKEASTGDFDRFKVSVTAAEALFILNSMRGELDKIEQHFDCMVEIAIDGTLREGKFRIEKARRKQQQQQRRADNEDEKEDRPSRNRRGGRGRKRKERDTTRDETVEEEVAEEASEEEDKPKKPRRTRGRQAKEPEEAVEPEAEAEAEPEEKPKRRRGRPAKKKESAEEKAEPKLVKDKPVEEPKAEEKPAKPKGPKRTGWWQKIVE